LINSNIWTVVHRLSSLRIYRVSLARATSCLGSAFSLSHGRISSVCSRGRSECLDTCPKALTSPPSQCKSIYPFYRTYPVECFVSSSLSSYDSRITAKKRAVDKKKPRLEDNIYSHCWNSSLMLPKSMECDNG
jgi:hypothetical protein